MHVTEGEVLEIFAEASHLGERRYWKEAFGTSSVYRHRPWSEWSSEEKERYRRRRQRQRDRLRAERLFLRGPRPERACRRCGKRFPLAMGRYPAHRDGKGEPCVSRGRSYPDRYRTAFALPEGVTQTPCPLCAGVLEHRPGNTKAIHLGPLGPACRPGHIEAQLAKTG